MKKWVIALFCLAATVAVSAPTLPQGRIYDVPAVDIALIKNAQYIADKYKCNIEIAYIVAAESRRSGVPIELLAALIYHESRFIIEAVSATNTNDTKDYGLMQLNSSNYELFKAYIGGRDYDMCNPAYNVRIGAAFLANLHKRFGSWALALAAYNAGPAAAARLKIPGRTVRYIKNILSEV